MNDAPGGAPSGLAARGAALDVVARCLAGEFLAPTLRAVLDASNLEGADRSLVADLAYGTVRRLPQLDAALAPYLKAPGRLPARVLVALRLAAYELLHRGTPAYAAVSAWVELVKGESRALAPLANAVLRRLSREGPAPASRPAGGPIDPERDLALPAWLWRRLVASLGEEAALRAAEGMLAPEPLWLTAFSERAEAVLEAQGCEVSAGPNLGAPTRVRPLRVRAPLPLDRLAAYREGLVQPQNPSSLYAALLAGAGEGDVVLDLAAGQGVKTAVLAALGARVVAVERSAKRTRAARANLRRLGLSVEHAVADLTRPPIEELRAARQRVEGGAETLRAAKRRLEGGAHAAESAAPAGEQAAKVLLDAPCSGTGTLRGHPEIKLRLTPEDVAELAGVQAALLDTAAQLVAPGGLLVYAVCSLLPEEGPRQIEALLARRGDLAVRDFEPPLPNVPGPHGRFVLPVDGLDGFFLARLERVS